MKKVKILPMDLYKFKLPEKLYDSVKARCNQIPWSELDTRDNAPHFGKSYPHQGGLHDKEDWKDLTRWSQRKVDEVVKDLSYTQMEYLKINLMWANKSEHLQWHHPHTHPNSILSGIIYIQGEVGSTWFSRSSDYDIRARYDVILPDPQIIHKQKPENGTLLIFPSTLMHSVDENKSSQDRITMSFNTFFKGTIGTGLTELTI